MNLDAMRQLTQNMRRLNDDNTDNSASKGDAARLLKMAYAYEDGDGVPKDKQKAFELYKKAANLGSVNGMFWTGMYYIYGEVTPQDLPRAFGWCKKAAENGQDDAMFVTGELYLKGEGVMRNVQKAVEWLTKSAEAGNMYAMFNLGMMYVNGKDVPVNHSEAVRWFERAAAQGSSLAMTALGDCYAHGLGVELNSAKAEYCYEKAIAAGDEEAKEHLDTLRNRGLCFITTAVCKSYGKPDDCYELTTFRKFRDDWLANQPDGNALIAEYYAIAPNIVDKINRRADAANIYEEIRQKYLAPCLEFIKRGDNPACKRLYVEMVSSLKKKFIA